MSRLVPSLLKVQVVRDVVFLVRSEEADRHVELTPSLLFDPEGRVLESCDSKIPTSVHARDLNNERRRTYTEWRGRQNSDVACT